MLGGEHVKQQEYEHAVLIPQESFGNQCQFIRVGCARSRPIQPGAVAGCSRVLRRAVLLNQKSINANLWLGRCCANRDS